MTPEIAKQIAHLLNIQNALAVAYDGPKVLKSSANYLWQLSEDGELIACAELKNVQWYQREIRHVTVNPAFLRKGWGVEMVKRCEAAAGASGARVAQCTIREGNGESAGLFTKMGYRKAVVFYNADTKNFVGVWQKPLTSPPA